jgi:hypothetical protein
MDMRAAFKETIELADAYKMWEAETDSDELSYKHIVGMYSRITSEFSEGKLGRWLGWAQAALVASGCGVTLDHMKELNKKYAG